MKTLKILCLIPVILLGWSILSFVIAGILEFPTSRSGIYELFAMLGILLLFIGWLPAFCISLAALITAKLQKTKKYIGFAIVDIVISVLWFLFSMLLFMGGSSV